MKSDFHVDKNLMQLSELLTDKEPYAALVVSTTGLDNKECEKHSPTRVQVVQYEFDDEIKQYAPSITFDKICAADIEAVDAAIAVAQGGGYDVFASAEIDPVSYRNQVLDPDLSKGVPEDQRVYSKEDFANAFNYVMQGLQHDNTTIIANGYEHSIKYLDKIGCADRLQQMYDADKVIDQPHLGGEYLKSLGRDDLVKGGSATLENVRNAVTPVPPAVKKFDPAEIAKDFKELSKEDFLDAHKNISEQAYKMKVRDDEMRSAKATAHERIGIINSMITTYGRDNHLLEDKHMENMRKNEAQRSGAASERGRQKYQNNSIANKIATQIEMGNIDKDAILEGNSEYNRLMSALHGDNGNKGVLFVHIATSGLNNPQGNETGLPMQFVARAVEIDPNGKGLILDAEHAKGVKFLMKLPPETVLKAEEQAKQRGGFDVFKDAGISSDEFKNNGNRRTLSEAAFISNVKKVFDMFEDYSIVALGGAKNEEKAFFQKALESICNLDVINKDTINFTQAVTAYSLLTVEGEIPDNAIFKDNPTTGFGIRQVAEAFGTELNGTSDKLVTVIKASSVLYDQYLELNPEIQKAKEETKAPVQETLDDFKEVDEPDQPVQEISDTEGEPEFADEDEGYDNTYTEEDEEADREKFEDSLIEPEDDAPAPISIVKDEPKAEKQPEPEKRPERVERKPVQQAEERPKRVEPEAPAPVKSEILGSEQLAALIEANRTIQKQNEMILRQNEVILRQSEIISNQDERFADMLIQQNELLKAVLLDRSSPAPAKEQKQERPKVVPITPIQGDTIDKLEQIKDNIDKICEEVPESVKNHLRDANSSISEGQVELETPKKDVEPRPVA